MPSGNTRRNTILVFGGTGFIGGDFARFAKGTGARVVICGSSLTQQSMVAQSVEVVQADATDLCQAQKVVRHIGANAIVFAISRIAPRGPTNVTLAVALAELRALANVIQCAGECGVEQFIYCSSGGAVYGTGAEPHIETDFCKPISLYGRLKQQCELLASTLCDHLGIRLATLRIGNPYGPGQSPFGVHGVIPIFAYKMLTGVPIRIFGSIDASKDYLFVSDVSAAILAAIDRRASGVFNIGSGAGVSLREVVRVLSEICGVLPLIEHQEISASEVASFVLDIAKARIELGWEPTVSFSTGISKTTRWIAESFL